MKVRDIEVGRLIGESTKFRVYLGTSSNAQPVILKVAKTFEDGATLAKEAGQFNRLSTFETEISALESAKASPSSHYDWLFAKLQSSFMEATQGDRRINVFTIPDIALDKLIPLAKIKAEAEIDVRTSIWILGRFFKFYSFLELLSFSEDKVAKYLLFNPNDYFIGPENHRLIYYNFSGEIEDAIASDFVKTITRFILKWVVVAGDPFEQAYLTLLEDFSENGRRKFVEAHSELYQFVKEHWGISYHPFTYRNRSTLVWNTIKKEG